MKRIIVFAVLAVLAACSHTAAYAQSTNAVVVANCGTPPTTYVAGNNRQMTQDTTGALCNSSANNIFWNEYVGSGTLLTASQSVFTPSRNSNQSSGSSGLYSYVVLFCNAAVAGTAYLQGSNDNTNWNTMTAISCPVGTPTYVHNSLVFQYYRINYINSASNQTGYFNLSIGFSVN